MLSRIAVRIGGDLLGRTRGNDLPARFAAVILPFASLIAQDRTWRHAQMLLLGALLTPGQRTVCAILRMVGLRWERHFVSSHRVLNRAVWRTLKAHKIRIAHPKRDLTLRDERRQQEASLEITGPEPKL